MYKKEVLGLIFGILIGIVAMSGCSYHNLDTVNVSIQNSTFNPSDFITFNGNRVNWTNHDSTTHRIVSDYGWFDSGNLAPGQSYNYTFDNTGAYPYHDALNSSIKGTVRVITSGSLP